MTRRVAYLIEEGRAQATRILALTFSRAAAQELRERLEGLLGVETGDRPAVSTLHAFALRQLLRNGGAPNLPSPIRIADDYEERWVIQDEIARLTASSVSDIRKELADLASDWETLKADEDEWEQHHPSPRFLGAWRHHRQVYGYTLRAELVYSVKKALEQNPNFELEREFTHILVDEYQDLNRCEIEVIRRLVEGTRDLFVAGDDDQSIYGFRNAFPQGLREFELTHPGSVSGELAECHRCDRLILDLAIRVAEQDPDRLAKALAPLADSGDGDVQAFGFNNAFHEAGGIARIAKTLVDRGVPAREILILLRNDPGGIYSRPIVEALHAEGLAAEIPHDPFAILGDPMPRLALCLLRLLRDPHDSLAWRQVLKLRDNGIGDTTLRSLYDFADQRGDRYAATLAAIEADVSLLASARRNAVRNEYRAVSVLLDELAPLFDAPALPGLQAVLDATGVAGDDAEATRAVLSSLLEDAAEATLADLVSQLTRLGAYRSDRAEPEDATDNKLRLMTMHTAKGLTADAVIIAACENELIPGTDRSRRAVDDQRRLLYVSLTRARHYLFLTYAANRPGEQSYRLQVPANRTYCSFVQDFLAPQIV